MLRRRASIGVIVAIAGPLVAYPAAAKPGGTRDTQKLAKALKQCRKNRSKSKRSRCEKTAKAKYESSTKTGSRKHTGAGTGTGTPTGTGTTTGTGTPATTPTTPAPEPILRGLPEPIPRGVSVISVQVTEGFPPRPVSAPETITEPHAVAEVIALIESLKRVPQGAVISCANPAPGTGADELELKFREPLQAEPVAMATGSRGCAGVLGVTIGNHRQIELFEATRVIFLVEELLGIQVPGER